MFERLKYSVRSDGRNTAVVCKGELKQFITECFTLIDLLLRFLLKLEGRM